MKIYLSILFSIQIVCVAFAQSPGITAVFDSKKNNVSIKWQHTNVDVFQYTLQRSSDNITWFDIFSEKAIKFKKDKIAKFTDQKPGTGKGYYRLKITKSQADISYSSSIIVIIGKPGNSWLMYPVPVSTILNLQYNGSELIPGVILVYIRTIKGEVLTRLRVASTTRLIRIPVANLGRGTYDIHIIIMEQVVWNQRFIK